MVNSRKISSEQLKINKQFINAFEWLRVNKYIKNGTQLGKQFKLSPGTISEYLNCKRPLSYKFRHDLEARLLKPHKLTLEDFEYNFLVKQAKSITKDTFESLIETQILVLEAGVRTILDKLSTIDKRLEELQNQVNSLRRLINDLP